MSFQLRPRSNLGYTGRYQIVDFPEMLTIQEDYLTRNNITNVDFLPLEMDKLLPREDDVSIMIATFSINEMPLNTRALIEPHYAKYDYLFVAHNTVFDGVDNMEYFKQLRDELKQTFEISYFRDPHRGLNMHFMICKKTKRKENK